MTDFPDWQTEAAAAAAISVTDLSNTGLAKENLGHLQAARQRLDGTLAGALLGVPGNTLAQEVAAWIAGGAVGATPGGTPLLHGVRQVYNVAAQVIPAAGTFTTPPITLAKPGFMARVSAQMSAAGAAVPFGEADLVWTVAGSPGATVYEEHWYFGAGGTATSRTNGRGPTKGDTLTITFTNGDAVDSLTISVTIWETTQHLTRDDWRSANGVASATAAAARGDGLANILYDDSFSVAGNATASRNLPLYAGQVNVWINQNTQAGSQIQIIPVGDFQLASGNAIASLDWTAAPHTYTGIVLPRCPCAISAINGGAAAQIFTAAITALEYAS